MVFALIQSYLNSPSLGRMCAKVKACNQMHCLTPIYMHAFNELDNIRFNYQFKVFTISVDTSLDLWPNLQSLGSSESNAFKFI